MIKDKDEALEELGKDIVDLIQDIAPAIEPVEPIEPTESVDLTKPIEPAELEKPVDSIKPIESVKSIEPIEPIESTKSTKPIVDDKDTLIESLRLRIEELSSPGPVISKTVEEPETKSVAPITKPVVAASIATKPVDFVGDEDLDNLLDTKEGLNKLLNMVANAAKGPTVNSEEIVQKAVEQMAIRLPNLVTQYTARTMTLNEMKNAFYIEHEDLKPYMKTVGAAANQLHSEHPDWDVGKILTESAAVVRKSLGLKSKVVDIVKKRSPAFVEKGSSSRREVNEDLKGIAGEIDTLIM